MKNSKKIALLIFITIAGILLTRCGGLVKLKIPLEAYENSDELWLMPNRNVFRHNTVDADIIPPYKILWSKKYKSVITDNPLAVDKYLIFTVKSGMLVLVDLELGEVIGDGRLAPGFNHSPLLRDNILYFAANLGNYTLGAFDISLKKLIWRKKLPQLNTSPILDKNTLFVGTNNGKLIALNRINAEKIWEFDSRNSIYGNPAIFGGNLFFSNVKGEVYCLDLKTGEEIWNKELIENIYSGPMITDSLVIIGNSAGLIYGLNRLNGNVKWKVNSHGSIYGNGAYRDGIIYIGNNAHKFIALDEKDGSLLWEFSTKGINNSPPLVGTKFVYFGSWDKNIYVLDRKSGELIYRQEFDQPIKSSPIIYQNRLFIHTANHRLYCLVNNEFASGQGW